MSEYLFSGLIKCGKCNYSYRGKKERSHKVYICNRYMTKGTNYCTRRVAKEEDLIFLIKTQFSVNNIEWLADMEYISNHVKNIVVDEDGNIAINYHKLPPTVWANNKITHE